jgi:flagellar biosynthesis/type III secretory pathway protein FliH
MTLLTITLLPLGLLALIIATAAAYHYGCRRTQATADDQLRQVTSNTRLAAYDEGYTRGYDDGHKAGKEEGFGDGRRYEAATHHNQQVIEAEIARNLKNPRQ